jgi:hypothetical protein
MAETIYVGIDDQKQPATGKVLEQILLDWEKSAKAQAEIEAQQLAKTQARESALAKLAALGLTQDEIDAL